MFYTASDTVENMDNATIGGGCFWCTEAIFKEVNGIQQVLPGYSGGTGSQSPSYEEVCTGKTGHAECIQIDFDSDLISYEELLFIFFATHDPTTLNKQGNDIGTQYRSVIFFHNLDQKNKAEKIIRLLNKSEFKDQPIVTKIEKFNQFFPAENYHKAYWENHKEQAYCQYIIRPKLEKFRHLFSDYLK